MNELSDFDKSIVDQLISFGFKHHSTLPTDKGCTLEHVYKYFPSYLICTHYCVVIHTYINSENSDHRLYIRTNEDSSYVDLVYVVANSSEWQRNKIREYIAITFASEIRAGTIKSIIND